MDVASNKSRISKYKQFNEKETKRDREKETIKQKKDGRKEKTKRQKERQKRQR